MLPDGMGGAGVGIGSFGISSPPHAVKNNINIAAVITLVFLFRCLIVSLCAIQKKQ
jgi:hypothetical protein